MRKLLKNLGGILSDAAPFLLCILVAYWLVGLGKQQVSETDKRIDLAAYAYPKEMISYGLTFANTDDQVLTTIQQWKDDRWGAQIGSLRVLCAKDFNYVQSLGGPGTGARICRLVK